MKKKGKKMEAVETKPRTLETIQTEYMKLVAMVGEKAYYHRVTGAEIEGLYVKINDLNQEAAKLKTTTETTNEKTETATH